MFDSIRSHRRWLMFFMLVLIFPSFVFFGIQGYNSFMETEGALATVSGKPITQRDFDNAQRDRVERLRQQLGAEFDPRVLDTPEGRKSILDGLIIDRALTQEVERGNLIVTNDRLREVIAGIPGVPGQRCFQPRTLPRLPDGAGPDGGWLRGARARRPAQADARLGCPRVDDRAQGRRRSA